MKSAVRAKNVNGVSPTKTSRSSLVKPKSNNGHLGETLNNINHGKSLSIEGIADELSMMHEANRNSALIDIQKTHGNQYTQDVVSGIQAKLKISHPGDIYEQEADKTADKVIRMPNPVKTSLNKKSDNLVKNKVPFIMPYSKSSEGINNAPSSVKRATNSPGHQLDSGTRSFMESRFGRDFSQVRIHTDSDSTNKINAHAFTKGNDIVFGAGNYQPGTDSGKRLLAHELTHVVQQSENNRDVVQRKAAVPEVKTAKPIGKPAAGKSQGMVDLKGKPTFDPPAEIAEWLDNQQDKKGNVNVRFGKLAQGTIEVKKVKDEYKIKRQSIPLIHPIFARINEAMSGVQPSLILSSESQGLGGYVGLSVGEDSPLKSALATQIMNNPGIIGLQGFDVKQIPLINEIRDGNLVLGVSGATIAVGGFSGTLTLEADDQRIKSFKGEATVSVRGLSGGKLELERSPEGLVTGKASVPLNLKKLSGNVEVGWDGQTITGIGVIGYQGEKLSGNLTINVMEESKAAQLEQGNQLPAKEDVVNIPKKAGKPKYVVFGSGELTFAFTSWLNGNANVILDTKGDVTIIGQITPQKEIELFPQKDYEKILPKMEARASYGIPIVGNIFIFANIGLSAFAKVGPAKFYKIIAEGTYSTDPKKSKEFKIKGSLNVSAAAGLKLRGEAGAGLQILAHDIKAGAGINALAGIRGYAEATPVVGYREKAKEGEDKKGEFFISGDLEIAAQPFLGLSGDLFVEVDSPFWSPVPDKKWTWPLAGKEWPIGGSFGLNASVDYVFGSKQWPKIEFKPVEFSANKFLTDLYSDKAKEKSGDKEKPGTWKENNGRDSEPPKGSKKGNVKPGAISEMPPAQPKVKSGKTRTVATPANPNAKTATGKTVGQYQREAERKGLGSKKSAPGKTDRAKAPVKPTDPKSKFEKDKAAIKRREDAKARVDKSRKDQRKDGKDQKEKVKLLKKPTDPKTRLKKDKDAKKLKERTKKKDDKSIKDPKKKIKEDVKKEKLKADKKEMDKKTRDEQLKKGLAALDEVTKRYAEKGAAKEEVKDGVKAVRRKFKVFKSIEVIDGGKTWDYEYVFNPKKKAKGPGKVVIPETYVTHTEESGKAKSVMAKPLTRKKGNTVGSRPTAEPKGWNEHIKTIPKYKDFYVRLHILSEKLHGPGSVIWNLTPGRKSENRLMEKDMETPAYNLIKGGKAVLWYESKITSYRPKPLDDFAEGIKITYGYMEKDANGKWVEDKKRSTISKPFLITEPDPKHKMVMPSLNTISGKGARKLDYISHSAMARIIKNRPDKGYNGWNDFEDNIAVKEEIKRDPNFIKKLKLNIPDKLSEFK